jgi:hypothetical protein
MMMPCVPLMSLKVTCNMPMRLKEAQLYYRRSTKTQHVNIMLHANHASIQ